MSVSVLDRPVLQPDRAPGSHRAPTRNGRADSVPAARASLPVGFGVAVSALLLFSVLASWLVAYAVSVSGLQEQRAQHGLYATLRAELAGETVPVRGTIKNGVPVALLDVPAAGVHRQVVVAGTSSADLQKGPGLLATSVLPGQAGVSAILGRSVTFGAPFGRIAHLKPGDAITATTGEGVFQYVVTAVRRAGDVLPAPLSGSQGRLTLVSLTGSGWLAGIAPSETVYVDASLQGAGKPPAAGRPNQTPTGQGPMDGQPAALVPVVFWLQALLVVGVAGVRTAGYWGRWQVWLVGAPLVLAIVWIATEAASRLLPNLL